MIPLKKYIDYILNIVKKDDIKTPMPVEQKVQADITEKPKRKYTKRKQNGTTIPKV